MFVKKLERLVEKASFNKKVSTLLSLTLSLSL